ncbi:MAG: hypothetical protein JJU28_20845 [Cyclobacteriaceae bacterium]|nr:hypothetical protein [Cyclobacteriaceae bacterium]
MKNSFQFLFYISFLISFTAFGQEKKHPSIELQGIVSEEDTGQPIGFVHISHKGLQGTVSQQDGYFVLNVQAGDTIHLSHMAYEDKRIIIPESYNLATYFVKLRLNPREFILDNIDVVDFLPMDIEAFKELILQTHMADDMWTENFILNDAQLQRKLEGRYFQNIEMSDYENFRRYLEGPQGVDLLGLFGLITQRQHIKNKSFGLLSRN